MEIRNIIKYILLCKNTTLTQLANYLTIATNKKYNVDLLSKKLIRKSLRAEEFKLILEILGYEIKVVKKVEEN